MTRRPKAPYRYAHLDPVREDLPKAGFYLHRLVKNGPLCSVRIWHGPPFDPVTREALDRSHCWRAEVNGEQVAVETVWPRCAAMPVAEAEYLYRLRLHEWAVKHSPSEPEANPRSSVDLSKLGPLF